MSSSIATVDGYRLLSQSLSTSLSEREIKFLRLARTDLTYVEIADKMCVSPRTIDGYRETLFEKLNAKSRTVMVLEALRLGVIEL